MQLKSLSESETRPHDQSWALQAALFLEAHSGFIGWSLVCLYVLSAVGDAAHKYLWYDELITTKIALLPNNAAILKFFSEGRDTTSATCALLDHLALKLPISPELAARLPFMLAFAGMLIFVYLFVRRRYPASFALSAPMFIFGSAVVRNYGVEARGYALLMLGTALAMFCWQTAISKQQRRFASVLGLWFGLALAINSHSFGVLLLVPFGLAELWRTRRNRSIDWSIWLAILCFPIGLLPVLHGQRLAQHYYGKSFWAQPQMQLIFSPYQVILFSVASVIYLVIFLFFAFGVKFRHQSRTGTVGERASDRTSGFTKPEWILLSVLALMPLYALPLSFLVHIYRSIYVIEFCIGLACVVSALFAELVDSSRRVGVVLFGALLLCMFESATGSIASGVHTLLKPRNLHQDLVQKFNAQPWVEILERSPLPIVASEHLTYAQMDFYGNSSLRERLTIPTNVSQVQQAPLSETGQENMILFGPVLGFQTEDIRTYVARHQDFLLAGKADPGDWITDFLLRRTSTGHASVQFLGPANTEPKGYAPVLDYAVHLDKGL